MKLDAIEMQYLLGKLSESEAEHFEQRYFADDSLFDEMELAEDDLIDAYVRDQLSAEDRKQFETKLLSSKRIAERVEFARLFAKSAPVSPVVVEPAKTGWWANLFSHSWVPNSALSGALAGVILLMVLGIPGSIAWMKLRNESKRLDVERAAIEQQRQRLDDDIAAFKAKTSQPDTNLQNAQEEQDELPRRREAMEDKLAKLQSRPPPVSVPASASFLLFSSISPRSSNQPGPRELSVPSSATTITLRLALDTNEYQSYTATIGSQARTNIFTAENLRPRRLGKRRIIELQFDSALLASGGGYNVEITPSGTLQPIASYIFNVPKK